MLNGGFEEVGEIAGIPSGWYYVRQATLEAQELAGHGKQMILFRNQEPGRAAQDCKRSASMDATLELSPPRSGWRPNLTPDMPPRSKLKSSIIFFDKDRVPIGGEILGPWHGTFGWRQETADWHVPEQARFATVIVGLTGGVGELALDDLALQAGDSKAAADR